MKSFDIGKLLPSLVYLKRKINRMEQNRKNRMGNAMNRIKQDEIAWEGYWNKIVRFKDVLNTFLFHEPFIAISHNILWTIFYSQSLDEVIFWSFIYLLRPFNFYHHKYCCNRVATFHFSFFFFVFLSFDIRNLYLRTRIILGFNFLSYKHLFLMHSDLREYLCIYIVASEM